MSALELYQPRHSADAEAALVGSLVLADPALQRRLRLLVDASDFYAPHYADLWRASCELLDAGKRLDAVTLYEALRDAGKAKEVGGSAAIAELLDTAFTPYHGESYAARVQEMSQRRAATVTLRKAMAALDGDGDAEAMNESIRSCAAGLMRTLNRRAGLRIWSIDQALHEWLDEKDAGRAPWLATRVPDLDDFPGIFRFGGYTIVGGRPSQGKSTFVRWLLGIIATDTPAGLIALEEDKGKIAGNYLSAETLIENDKVAYGTLSDHEMRSVTNAVGTLSRRKLYGCDQAFNLEQVIAAAETMVVEHGCRVLAIDHIHLMQHGKSRSGKSSWNRNDQLTEMSSAMKELGKRHGVVLIVAAQLSRPEKVNIPPPPRLTDLRESGSLEQDADSVIMLHREDYYRRDGNPDYLCRVGIEKNRNGKVGYVTLKADLAHQRFLQPDNVFEG